MNYKEAPCRPWIHCDHDEGIGVSGRVPQVKVVILAGGLGTRLSEETALKPKPMVEIGGRPILWHIMKIYATTASATS